MEKIQILLDFLEFPPVHTCDGGDKSPALHIKGLDAGSVAVWVTNPYIRSCCSFSPWVIWGIPPAEHIPAGIPNQPVVSSPVSCLQGRNDYGNIGYTGPCPPPGETHRYQFRVYGLDCMLTLTAGSSKHDLVAAMRGHVVQFGETVAICTR
jgi:Raf kinase inhibitor-like YbhB/YbcL family protein